MQVNFGAGFVHPVFESGAPQSLSHRQALQKSSDQSI